MRLVRTLAAGALTTLAACTVQPTPPLGEPRRVDLPPDQLQLASLETFSGCDEMLSWMREQAAEVDPSTFLYGTVRAMTGTAVLEAGVAADAATSAGGPSGGDGRAAATPSTAAPAPQADAAAPDAYSRTNVQEAGVDEPDIVKTDGRRVVAIAQNRLHVVDVTGETPALLGSTSFDERWSVQELLLEGDRALVFARSYREQTPEAVQPGQERRMIMPVGTPLTVLAAVDLSDPAAPEVSRTLEVEGDYASSRLVDGIARVVVRSAPQLAILEPRPGPKGMEQAVEKAIAHAEPSDWLPDVVSGDGAGAPAVGCDQVHRPPQFAGPGVVTVLTVDARDDLAIADSVAVMADAQTVYASTTGLYVATTRWQWISPAEVTMERPNEGVSAPAPREDVTTEIHRFNIADPARTAYVGSGRVPGYLLNQWSLSEHEDHLRVATTEGPQWGPAGERQSESFVTVLASQGDALVEVGRVGGLGKGERIYAVRFMGDVGYVVTFRQVDPLYTLDLADPAHPKVVGELKIPGYSAYLHPVGDGLLLGVGQDATEEGMRLGAQVSLFDVSDPSKPERLHQLMIGGSSMVEGDHRAFLWWAPEGVAMVPVETWDGQAASGVAVIEVSRDGLRERGRVGHAGQQLRDPQGGQAHRGQPGETEPGAAEPGLIEPGLIDRPGPSIGASAPDIYRPVLPVVRSVVIGGDLLTLSDAGLLRSDLGTLGTRGWVAF